MKTRTFLLFPLVFALWLCALVIHPPHAAAQLITSNGSVFTGQQTATSSAVALTAKASKTVCVKALTGNTATLYLGGSDVTSGNGMELTAGNSWCGNIQNVGTLFIIAPSGSPVISWMATN